ncbi:hypothetical protein Tco_1262550 [Tanacetum coccineum]
MHGFLENKDVAELIKGGFKGHWCLLMEKVGLGKLIYKDVDYALDGLQTTQALTTELVAHQQGQLWYEQKIKFMKIDLDDKTEVLTYHKKLLAEAQKQKEDGIFISQDKYVAKILRKFDFANVKTASTPIETLKPLVKDEEASDVDVHLYRSMIGSLMYLTASRPDIMFAVCACLDCDYAGANLRHGTHNRRLSLSWQEDSSLGSAKKAYHCALISTFTTLSSSSKMAVLDSCPKHNMVAYLEKSEGNEEFYDIIDFLKRSSIHFALTISPIVSTTFVEQFWTSAKSKTINNVRHIIDKVAWHVCKQLVDVSVPLDHFPVNTLTSKVFSFMVKKGKHFSGKVTSLFASMLVQPTQDESEALPTPSPTPTSEVPSEQQTDSSPAQISKVPIEYQPNLSPRPSPSNIIPASIPETSGDNLRGHSSNDKSLLGNEGDMTIQGVYDLCLSLCKQVSDQAKEIQALKAQITKLKKQAKPVIKHHKAYLKSVSLKQRFPRKSFLKET